MVAAAYSHELTKYGVVAGFKNFAAAYATGLLLARRVLVKYGLADTYKVRHGTKFQNSKISKFCFILFQFPSS